MSSVISGSLLVSAPAPWHVMDSLAISPPPAICALSMSTCPLPPAEVKATAAHGVASCIASRARKTVMLSEASHLEASTLQV